ncbi:hypothetical protein N7468_000234 [Penicillium chermesinum]|uniref:Uncharacterized protein n=1 Tax=Penicillium chermesinum TaxID=63820 RepID=A0A9W9PLK4_9EURO|nr:uncharacterized protein N7468_000234 [Penicillium chermesinum]KAJ5248783.1 hypothetical protein N7468_000234 [Penicillium chermesinum]
MPVSQNNPPNSSSPRAKQPSARIPGESSRFCTSSPNIHGLDSPVSLHPLPHWPHGATITQLEHDVKLTGPRTNAYCIQPTPR